MSKLSNEIEMVTRPKNDSLRKLFKTWKKVLDKQRCVIYNWKARLERYRSGHNEAVLKCDWFQWVYSLKSFYKYFEPTRKHRWNTCFRWRKRYKTALLGNSFNRSSFSTNKSSEHKLLQIFLQNVFCGNHIKKYGGISKWS